VSQTILETYIFEFKEKGGKVVIGTLDGITSRASVAEKAVGDLNRAVASVGPAASSSFGAAKSSALDLQKTLVSLRQSCLDVSSSFSMPLSGVSAGGLEGLVATIESVKSSAAGLGQAFTGFTATLDGVRMAADQTFGSLKLATTDAAMSLQLLAAPLLAAQGEFQALAGASGQAAASLSGILSAAGAARNGLATLAGSAMSLADSFAAVETVLPNLSASLLALTNSSASLVTSFIGLSNAARGATGAIGQLSSTALLVNTAMLSVVQALNATVSNFTLLGAATIAAATSLQNVALSGDMLSATLRTATVNVAALKGNLTALSGSAATASHAFGGLGKMLGMVGGFFAARKIKEYIDDWQKLNNEIRTVTSSEAEAIDVRNKLVAATTKAEAPLGGTVKLYQRLSLVNDTLGKSQKELIDITTGVGQALAISGASASETRSVLLQLAQGLGTAALNGDEFRSVIENGPVIIKAVADELGIGVSQVKEWAAQGKLSSKQFVDAFQKALPKIEKMFEKTKDTLARSVTYLHNKFMIKIGLFSESEEAGALAIKLGKALRWLGDNAEYLAGAMAALVAIFIPKLIAGLIALGAACVGHPFLTVTAGLIMFGTYLVKNRNEIKATEDGLVTLGNVGKQAWTKISDGMVKLFRDARGAKDEVGGLTAEFAKLVASVIEDKTGVTVSNSYISLETYLTDFAEGLDMTIGFIKGTILGVVAILISAVKTVANTVNMSLNSIISMLNAVLQAAQKLFHFIGAGAIKIPKIPKLSLLEGWEQLTLADQQKLMDDSIAGFTWWKDKVQEIFAAARKAAKPPITIEVGVDKDLETDWEKMEKAFNTGFTLKNAFLGARQGVIDFGLALADVHTLMKDFIKDTFTGLSKEITEALTGGEADFRAFARSAINSIIQIMVQALMLKAIMAAVGMVSPGASAAVNTWMAAGSTAATAGSTAAASGKQFGGSVGSGKPYLVGETRPELFVPSTAGRVAPSVQQEASSPNIRIVNAVDGDSVFRNASRSVVDDVVINAISRNSSRLRGVLAVGKA